MTTTTNAVSTKEVLESLIGKKATIFKYGEMGFAHSIECVIEKVYNKDYAQYNNQLHVIYRPKRGRKQYAWRPFDYQTFAIFEGHVSLNTDMWVETKETGCGATIRESLDSFSEGYLDRALKSTTQIPLFIQRHED